MATSGQRGVRLLPDGTPLHKRLLGALPARDYARIVNHLQMIPVTTGRSLQEAGQPVTHVHFPNGGVFSVTNENAERRARRDGNRRTGGHARHRRVPGRSLGRRANIPTSAERPPAGNDRRPFVREIAPAGPFRNVVGLYAQAHVLQIMQGTACNALHGVKERCCRWLLQTQDRVGSTEFLLKHEFLAIMLGVHRPTVTLVIGALQHAGLISSRYGRIRVLKRRKLEDASCECLNVTRLSRRIFIGSECGYRRIWLVDAGGSRVPVSRWCHIWA